jgi:FMN reductase
MPDTSPSAAPFIIGIGGTTRAGSSTERAMRSALDAAAGKAARTYMFDGPFLAKLPNL